MDGLFLYLVQTNDTRTIQDAGGSPCLRRDKVGHYCTRNTSNLVACISGRFDRYCTRKHLCHPNDFQELRFVEPLSETVLYEFLFQPSELIS